MELLDKLYKARNFDEIFNLVKRLVYEHLGYRRAGLSLVLEDLPIGILGYHAITSNFIVVNRRVLEAAERLGDRRLLNSLIYIVLLHEYLHSLGILSESRVRKTVTEITEKYFGRDVLPYRLSLKPYNEELIKEVSKIRGSRKGEIIRDFDRESTTYIG